MSTINVVAVSGNPAAPSRTLALVAAILSALKAKADISADVIDVATVGGTIGRALSRKELDADGEAVITRIERAELLVVASPTYRATYTGLFKHLFDLVGYEALVGVPVILAATGGSERHALLIEHQLRPLFGFFRSLTVPTGIYAVESDFDNYELVSPAVSQRIHGAVDEALRLLRPAERAAVRLRAIA